MKALKKSLISTSMAVALGVSLVPAFHSQPAHALLPTTDYAAFGLKVKGMMLDGVAYAKEQMLLIQQMDLQSILSQMTIDNANNGFANVVVRLGGALQDIQNLEQMENSVPAQDACSTISASVDLGDALCASSGQLAQRAAATVDRRKMAVGKGTYKCDDKGCEFVEGVAPNSSDVHRHNAEEAKKIVDACENLKDENGDSLCDNPTLLVAPPGEHLNVNEYKAAEIQIELAAGVERPVPIANEGLDKDSDQFKRAQAADMRREGIREKTLANKQLVFTIENGSLDENEQRIIGEMAVLDKFLDERVGSEYWICEVTNACDKSTTKYVSPAELEKRKTQMQAMGLYVDVQAYKSSLRIEQLLTDLVLLEVSPVDK